jgi:hypothetical protein
MMMIMMKRCKRSGRGLIKSLSRHFVGGTGVNSRRLKSGYPVLWAEIGTWDLPITKQEILLAQMLMKF